ncbi:MAG: hypothetical protein O2973_14265 [Gemmatimonadetes bacterium]|nr:hypothetical protein [Gemmatimonadota bacterium]
MSTSRALLGGISVLLAIATGAMDAAAQPTLLASGVRRERGVVAGDSSGRSSGRLAVPTDLARRDSSWWVPLSSTIVPGLGQLHLGQSRAVAYAAVEAYAIFRYVAGEAAVRRERGRYLTLARDIARAFVPGNTAIGDWDYYEAMEKHIESGVFDRAPGTGSLAPEGDVTTFNGAVWLKARQLSNWPDVDVELPHSSAPYQAAIAYYLAHAVGPEYRWSWRNAQLEWDVYRQSIRQKNAASRDAGHYLAVLAFNHLLSTVDAFVTLRLRGGLGAGGVGGVGGTGYRVTASLPFR